MRFETEQYCTNRKSNNRQKKAKMNDEKRTKINTKIIYKYVIVCYHNIVLEISKKTKNVIIYRKKLSKIGIFLMQFRK